jgi:hypothetical protein
VSFKALLIATEHLIKIIDGLAPFVDPLGTEAVVRHHFQNGLLQLYNDVPGKRKPRSNHLDFEIRNPYIGCESGEATDPEGGVGSTSKTKASDHWPMPFYAQMA